MKLQTLIEFMKSIPYHNFKEMKSPVMQEIIDKCFVYSANPSKPVLLVGEYGTGKGWIARLIHNLSYRKDFPFSKLNCNALPPDEIAKKLFGHLSFNDDMSVRINRGLFELNNGGTIFFNGFESLPVQLQQQIIESVQKKSIQHIGSTLSIRTDVRIITALDRYIDDKKNLNKNDNYIFEINPQILFLPPLRNRREDIAPLIHKFLNSSYSNYPDLQSDQRITPKALYLCIHYNWPGNVRQLQNALKYATLLSKGKTVQPKHLPHTVKTGLPSGQKLLEVQNSKSFQTAEMNLLKSLIQSKLSAEKLALCLGLSTHTVQEKIKKYHLEEIKTEIQPTEGIEK